MHCNKTKRHIKQNNSDKNDRTNQIYKDARSRKRLHIREYNGFSGPEPEELAIRLSAPHTGIGSDGLVLIGSSKIADFSMRIFNVGRLPKAIECVEMPPVVSANMYMTKD